MYYRLLRVCVKIDVYIEFYVYHGFALTWTFYFSVDGHAKGKAIVEQNALNGLGLPLHPGAERFYKEAGLLK